MKNLSLLLIIISFAKAAGGQSLNIDTALKFDKIITTYERHWVVLKKPDKVKYYTFGYVYIQSDRGFMFKPAGQFKIDGRNRYVLGKGEETKYMLNVNSKLLSSSPQVIRQHDTTSFMDIRNIYIPIAAALPPQHFAELKVKAEPECVKPFYSYTDTLEHNYRWGCYHFEEGDYATGIDYFEKVYKVSPHYKGVKVPMDNANWINHQGIELKLSAAYNRTGQYSKAISILNKAISNDPTHIPFYQELILSYMWKEDWNMLIKTAKQGLKQITVEKSDQKRDLAACIAKGYEELKNNAQGKYWREKSLDYSICRGCVY